MILFLRLLFIVVIASMLWATTRAGMNQSLGDFARSDTFRDPWVVATLIDAYWAFISFYVWIAWKEQSLASRVLWFIAVILLGNFAMATYMLRELFAVSARAPDAIGEVFTRRRPGALLLPGLLTGAAVGVYLLA